MSHTRCMPSCKWGTLPSSWFPLSFSGLQCHHQSREELRVPLALVESSRQSPRWWLANWRSTDTRSRVSSCYASLIGLVCQHEAWRLETDLCWPSLHHLIRLLDLAERSWRVSQSCWYAPHHSQAMEGSKARWMRCSKLTETCHLRSNSCLPSFLTTYRELHCLNPQSLSWQMVFLWWL